MKETRMEKHRGRAPSYAELRPIKGRTPTFPVYSDLVSKLTKVPRGTYDPIAAHVCAVASGWAYADAETDAMMLARLGLEENWYYEASICNDAMFIASHALLVQSRCGRVVVLAYRGTEPRNFINWLTDADVNPVKVPYRLGERPNPDATVHGGFYRNLRATWHEVVGALRRAVERKPVDPKADDTLEAPMEALYVTGHSLGAAMAALAGVRLVCDDAYRELFTMKLRGIYTYGQPMVGNPAFAEECTAQPFLATSIFRHVYEHDVVPRLPPTATGPFQHFGVELGTNEAYRWTRRDGAVDQVRDLVLATLVIPVLAFAGKQLEKVRNVPFPYSWYDHLPSFYIEASTPPDVRSEFER
jgi:lipase (class 3)